MAERTDDVSLRRVMASYPTGVTVVAARDDMGEPFGLTVNSFTSVSLDPPLILVCIGDSSTSHDRFVASRHFSVNLLSGAQGAVAGRFAVEPSVGRFDDFAWKVSDSGSPILEGVVGWLDCEVHEILRGGDHSIVIGRVMAADANERPALVYHRGTMTSIAG